MTRVEHPTEIVWQYETFGKPYLKAHSRNAVIFRCSECKALDYIDRCGICGSTKIERFEKVDPVRDYKAMYARSVEGRESLFADLDRLQSAITDGQMIGGPVEDYIQLITAMRQGGVK